MDSNDQKYSRNSQKVFPHTNRLSVVTGTVKQGVSNSGPQSKVMWWETSSCLFFGCIGTMPDPKSQICRKCHQAIRTAKGGLAKHRVHCKAKQREIRLARQAREEYRNHLQGTLSLQVIMPLMVISCIISQSVVRDKARSPTESLGGQDLDIPSPGEWSIYTFYA